MLKQLTHRIRNLRLKEVSGVDAPAHQIPGWAVQKSADLDQALGQVVEAAESGVEKGALDDVLARIQATADSAAVEAAEQAGKQAAEQAAMDAADELAAAAALDAAEAAAQVSVGKSGDWPGDDELTPEERAYIYGDDDTGSITAGITPADLVATRKAVAAQATSVEEDTEPPPEPTAEVEWLASAKRLVAKSGGVLPLHKALEATMDLHPDAMAEPQNPATVASPAPRQITKAEAAGAADEWMALSKQLSYDRGEPLHVVADQVLALDPELAARVEVEEATTSPARAAEAAALGSAA